MNYREEYRRWCESELFDEATRAECRALRDEREIEDRFYKTLTFGTGGLRGELGAGTNRMNEYTVGKATQGLADRINACGQGGSVVIAYDSRRMSAEFALSTACIFAANGVKAYLFRELRPTPMLSFAVRFLHATAGVVITASHNPPQYNGYKVYWSDGGQIVPPYDEEIIACVNAVDDYSAVRRIGEEEACRRGLLVYLGNEVDDAYHAALRSLSCDAASRGGRARDLKIVYTPLNGTGNLPVRRALREAGFSDVFVVKEQEAPDGNFPTLALPNPEDPRAFDLALRLAAEVGADLVLATDPDADRLGLYARDGKSGEYKPFTGNMSGILLADYLLSRRAEQGLLPACRADGALVTTVVSSKMAHALAAAYGLTVIETLTGFKYIGEQIKRFGEARERNGGRLDHTKGAFAFEFGFEESYGCLAGTYARDKDAVGAALLLCEAAAYYRDKGLTLWDRMLQLYERYGYYRESLASFSYGGADGAARIRALMQSLRAAEPRALGGETVVAVRDYLCGTRKDLRTGKTQPVGLPRSNVLYFELEHGGWCCARPSGTEPKIKFYFGAKGKDFSEADTKAESIRKALVALANEE